MDEKKLYKGLGEMIAARRNKMELNQAELAKQVNMSRASIANIEVGRQRVLVHQLYLLAEALELTDGPRSLLPIARAVSTDTLPMPEGGLTVKQKSQIEQLVGSISTTKPKTAKT
jgi:transcriptional regulator with XRE-family HTH domain